MKGHDGRTTLPTTTTTVLEIPSQDRPRYKSRFANYQGVVQKIRGQDEVGRSQVVKKFLFLSTCRVKILHVEVGR